MPDERRSRIRLDLERRGVARAFSEPVAQRLEAIAEDFTPAEYAAVLDGVATAYGVHRDEGASTGPVPTDLEELARLLSDFQGELSKLDEGVRILSAYLTRMRRSATPPASILLH